MGLYIGVISGTTVLVAVGNLLFSRASLGISPLYCIIAAVLTTVAIIALDGLEAWLIRLLPEKWFAAEQPLFAVSARECRFYNRLGVKSWRNKVPELGSFTHFSKSHVADPKDNAYLRRFLLESNYGVVIHLTNALSGYLLCLLFPAAQVLRFPLPCAVVNMVLSLLPVFILRYNTPRLQSLIHLNERRAAK